MELSDDKLNDLLQKMNEILNKAGFNWYWLLSVGALVTQELVLKKTLISLGVQYSDDDFQKLAQRLIDELKRRNIKPPVILSSIVRSYRHIRAKLVHNPKETFVLYQDAKAILENTLGFVDALSEYIQEVSASEILEVVLEDIDRALDTFRKLSYDNKIRVIDALVDELSSAYMSYTRGECILKFISKAIASEPDELKINCAEIFIKRVIPRANEYGKGVWETLRVLISSKKVREFLKNDRRLIDLIVSSFSRCNSFYESDSAAACLLDLINILDLKHVENILQAFVENDQITYAWKVPTLIKAVVNMYMNNINVKLLEQVRETMRKLGKTI